VQIAAALKGIVHPKIKISPLFAHPEANEVILVDKDLNMHNFITRTH